MCTTYASVRAEYIKSNRVAYLCANCYWKLHTALHQKLLIPDEYPVFVAMTVSEAINENKLCNMRPNL